MRVFLILQNDPLKHSTNKLSCKMTYTPIFFLLAIKKILFAENSSILAKIFLKPTFPGFMSTLNILK